MNEKIHRILELCLEAKTHGHDVFFRFCPQVGWIEIDSHKNGWKKGVEPDRRFCVYQGGEPFDSEFGFDVIIEYLEALNHAQ